MWGACGQQDVGLMADDLFEGLKWGYNGLYLSGVIGPTCTSLLQARTLSREIIMFKRYFCCDGEQHYARLKAESEV